MPSLRLTKRAVDEVPFEKSGQTLYRDSLLPGFGLRVGTSKKTYYVEGKVNRRTVRTTIGRADLMVPDDARKKALAILSKMAEGTDPNEAKRQ